MQASRKILLVWSQEFFEGDWTTFETRIIQLRDPVGRKDRVIPLLHTPCQIPDDWSFRQALDFTEALFGTIEFEFRYQQLIHALDPSRRYEGDFERFKATRAGNRDSALIPPVQSLPRGSRMPHAPNPLFVGREKEMRDLDRMLTPGATVGVHAAVSGMGGVGKTQLAIEYAYHYGKRYPGGVFWLSFAKEEEITTAVAACGGHEAESVPGWNAMKPPEQAAIVQRIWHESDQPRLLIFDNAEEPVLVEKWRPRHGRCGVLLTCRRDEWPAKMGVKPLPIETLPREKSMELLQETRPSIATSSKDRETSDKICDILGDLPLALSVAAAYLRKYKNDSLTEYLEALSSKPTIKDSSLEEELSASFAISFNKLDPNNPTDALSQNLFYLASFFAPISINRALLAASSQLDYSKKDARHQADDSLSRLQELGLIKQEPDGRLLLHRLLREFASQNPPKEMDSHAALNTVGESLDDFGNREFESGLPHALDRESVHFRHVATEIERHDPDLAARLYNHLGINGRALALFHEAKADSQRAVELGEAVYGPEAPMVAIYLNNLGLVLKSLGDLLGAQAHYERALKIDESVYGPDHPKIATRLTNLGSVFYELGDPKKARANFERALKIDEAVYGPDHPNIAIILNNLGRVLRALGDLANTRANVERALKISEAVYGPEHPTIALRLHNLGWVLHDMGDLTGARANFERSLQIHKKVYGDDHANTRRVQKSLDSLNKKR